MGRDKAWLPVGPEVLLQRVVRRVGHAVDRVVVVAAPGQALPELAGPVAVVRDRFSGEGPLRALATGLGALPESDDLIFVAATDSPFLHPGWVGLLADLIADHDLAVPRAGGRFHPLGALYRRGPTVQAAEALLASGRRRLMDLVEGLRGLPVDEHLLRLVDPDLATLRNLNTPDDYLRALGDASLIPSDDLAG